MNKVTIIDYGHGNANSIKWALAELGADSTYSHDRRDVDAADCIILPGVGHHKSAMESLAANDLVDPLNRAALERKVPVLGICLGMQIVTRSSEEGGAAGLGWVDAVTTRVRPARTSRFKVPHVGWNTLRQSPRSKLLAGIDVESEPFYFCHSFAIEAVPAEAVTAPFSYDREYVGLFELGNVFGVQFHPEKSQEPGLALLSNFLKWAG